MLLWRLILSIIAPRSNTLGTGTFGWAGFLSFLFYGVVQIV